MKVSTTRPQFTPVVITLETQEEVDQMHSLLNSQLVCPFSSPLGNAFNLIAPHADMEASDRIREATLARASAFTK